MLENLLNVKMLGGFSLYYNGKELVVDRSAVSKTLQLLQLILLHAEDGIAKLTLIDALYGRDEVENKNGSLNNTMFRLRRQLKNAGLPGDSYFTIDRGICRWDGSAIPLEIDCCVLEKKYEQSLKEADRRKRIEIFREICDLYTGEFLPDMLGEDWVAVGNIHYRDIYFACLEELCQYLQERELYEELCQRTAHAAQLYPFENWHLIQIDSLIAMSRYREAMDVYEKMTKKFLDEMGLPPTAEMLERFRHMGEKIQESAGAIDDIRQRLKEKDYIDGAYYCTFPSFLDIYHIIGRMLERNGLDVYIMLCTLKNKKNKIYGETEREKEASETLREAIRRSLRKGDFYTKYNLSQYLVMLSGINRENCTRVSGRIDRAFCSMLKGKDFQVDYYVASVSEICPEDPDREKKFRSMGERQKNRQKDTP